MGNKYTSVAISGYNVSAPTNNGAKTSNNLITWDKHKEKLGDPIKTALELINTNLVAALDEGPSAKTSAYTTIATDHFTTIECNGTFSLSLGDAATMTVGYRVRVKNTGSGAITVNTDTPGDGIDGNTSTLLNPGEAGEYQVNATADGYLSLVSASPVPSGTKMLFQQTAAPTGWTKETTHNDKALRVVSGNVSNGGTDNFSICFNSDKTTDSMTLTKPMLPPHFHTYLRQTVSAAIGTGPGAPHAETTANTGDGSSDGLNAEPFTIPLTLDLKYVDIIIATKD